MKWKNTSEASYLVLFCFVFFFVLLLFPTFPNPRAAHCIERVRDGGGHERNPTSRDGVASPGSETKQKASETFATTTGTVSQSQHTLAG